MESLKANKQTALYTVPIIYDLLGSNGKIEEKHDFNRKKKDKIIKWEN